MKISYEGIGQWAATFGCAGVAEGQMVKAAADDTVAACDAGDVFCGAVISVGHAGDACSVALGGLVTACYTGTAPAIGYASLSADGLGGVQCDAGGRSYLVIHVDSAAKTVTFAL